MRVLKLNLSEEVTLDLFNSIFGKESVFYNGELVSEKRSLFGATHDFEIEENGYWATYSIRFKHDHYGGTVADIFRNNKVILLN